MGGAPECAVQTLQPATVNLTSSYPATIKGKQDVEIRPQVSGFITKVCVDEGSMVRKGRADKTIEKTSAHTGGRILAQIDLPAPDVAGWFVYGFSFHGTVWCGVQSSGVDR